jgi:hypothetical protein
VNASHQATVPRPVTALFSVAMRVLLAIIVVGSLAAAGEQPRPPADVGRWIEVTVPRDGTRGYDRFLAAATVNSAPDWYVTVAGGRVVARDEPPIGPAQPFKLRGPELGDSPVRQAGRLAAVRVLDGWLVGYNAGEFGGAVFWYSADGKQNRRLSDLRIHQFVETKGGVYATTGSAGGVLDYGPSRSSTARRGVVGHRGG